MIEPEATEAARSTVAAETEPGMSEWFRTAEDFNPFRSEPMILTFATKGPEGVVAAELKLEVPTNFVLIRPEMGALMESIEAQLVEAVGLLEGS